MTLQIQRGDIIVSIDPEMRLEKSLTKNISSYVLPLKGSSSPTKPPRNNTIDTKSIVKKFVLTGALVDDNNIFSSRTMSSIQEQAYNKPNIIVDSSATFGANTYSGYDLIFSSGSANGLPYEIISHSNTNLVIKGDAYADGARTNDTFDILMTKEAKRRKIETIFDVGGTFTFVDNRYTYGELYSTALTLSNSSQTRYNVTRLFYYPQRIAAKPLNDWDNSLNASVCTIYGLVGDNLTSTFSTGSDLITLANNIRPKTTTKYFQTVTAFDVPSSSGQEQIAIVTENSVNSGRITWVNNAGSINDVENLIELVIGIEK